MTPKKRLITTHEAKTHLSQLLKRVSTGEEIIICSGKTPVARLMPIEAPSEPRIAGEYRGQIWMAADFDDSSDFSADIHGSKIEP